MRNFFIIHGGNGGVDASWGKWLKDNIEKYGEVIAPSFPIREDANPQAWEEVLDKYKNKINNQSIFICHSIGCLFSITYLSKNNLPIAAIIFVAGPGNDTISNQDEDKKNKLEKIMRPFLPSEKDRDKFVELANNRYAIYSNDDHILSIESLKLFAKGINAEELMIPNKGHFGKKADIKEIPEVLGIIKNLV